MKLNDSVMGGNEMTPRERMAATRPALARVIAAMRVQKSAADVAIREWGALLELSRGVGSDDTEDELMSELIKQGVLLDGTILLLERLLTEVDARIAALKG